MWGPQLIARKNTSRVRGNLHDCSNHLGGKLNVENRLGGVRDALDLALGSEPEVTSLLVLALIPGSAEEPGRSGGAESSAKATICRSQQRVEMKPRALVWSAIRASVVSLNSLYGGVQKMGRTINLYWPNERNDAALPVLVI